MLTDILSVTTKGSSLWNPLLWMYKSEIGFLNMKQLNKVFRLETIALVRGKRTQ